MTGATGFLGAHLAVELLKGGYSLLLLVRKRKQADGRERVGRLLRWFGVDLASTTTVEVIEGQIDKPGFGLDNAVYDRLAGNVEEIVHCASSTAFSERKRPEVEAINIDGLRNVLDFAGKSECFYFHHLSTSYVAGRRSGWCKEELIETDEFTNVYEETKYHGERIVSQFCAEKGIRLNVYRPSIVYGNSKNGRSTKFNALYYPIRTLHFFRGLYEKDIVDNGGKRAAQAGVTRGEDGTVCLPIRIKAKQEGGINLIPIDYFTRSFMAIMEECVEGGVFHIVNHRVMNIKEIVRFAERFFKLKGLEVCNGYPGDDVRNPLEILFDVYNKAYEPYIQDDRLFENERTANILRRKDIECPDFSFDVFFRCMTYAIETDWGAKL